MRSRAVRLLSLVLLPALGAGACSKGDSSAGSLGLAPGSIAAAAIKTIAAKSARLHLTVNIKGVEGTDEPADFTIEGDGRMELGRVRGELVMDMGALGIPGADGKMEMRLIDTIIYMKMPQGLGDEMPLPAGKKWIKMDMAAMAGEGGFDMSDLQSFGMGDPAQLLDFLKEIGAVKKAGSETIRGTNTTHYTGVIDFAKLLSKAGTEKQADIKEIFGDKPPTMPVEVWIGKDGFLRRMDFSFDLSEMPDAPKDAKMSMRMEMFDFGISVVDVVAPPASEVLDFQKMMSEMGASS